MYVKLDDTGRVCALSMDGILPDGIESVAPESWDGMCPRDLRLEGGVLVYDPMPKPEPPPDPVAELQAEVADLTLALADMIGGGAA